jgi:4-diphosphocytidyl-2-C-methyl-D-erythritol kinase
LFQSIDLGDTLEFRQRDDGQVRLSGSDPAIPWDERNLIYRAANLLKEKCPAAGGADVEVAKKVPAGTGLGGGSSNAAMALYALNRLWGIGLDTTELRRLAATLGADVPFFLDGGLCLGEGRGDRITSLPDLPSLFGVLVLPSFPILTSDIYSRLRLTSPPKDSKIKRFLARREFGLLENNLEETVFSLYPRLKAIKSFFYQREAVLSLVSGSGSAVFGLYPDRGKARRVLAGWEGPEEALLVETISRERYWERVTAGV